MVSHPVARLLDEQPLDSAVIDAAHLGDIRGAFGTVRWRQLWPARTWRRRLAVLATVMGPGLLALLADNDAGGIATYAQAGQDQGTRLLWVLLPLGAVLFLNQEMAARLGAVSGVGHARLITERFGRLWGAFSVGDLLLLNVLTLVTEFIGVRIAAEHVGIAPGAAVCVAAAVLIGATLSGGFQRWERVMYLLVAVDVALVPMLLLAHPAVTAPAAGRLGTAGLQPMLVLVVALVGTTISPWQLFFQQSAVVDKRITPRWLNYARLDTALGTLFWLGGAAAVMVLSATAAGGGGGLPGHAGDAGVVLAETGSRLGAVAGDLLALLLLDGALLGAAVLAMATSYAVGDVTGTRHSLHRTPRQAPVFYAVATAVVAAAAGVVLLPGVPLGFTTVFVQVLTGLLTPSATLFLLLLCNDAAVLGPWSNPRWLNAVVSAAIAGLLALSGMLVMTALFPRAPSVAVGLGLGGAAAGGLAWVGVSGALRRRRLAGALWTDAASTPRLRVLRLSEVVVLPRRARVAPPPADDRAFWRTPPLDELRRPTWSAGRLAAMVALRAYMVAGVLLLAGRAVATALGH
jgi:Mn2+/Fe2+ NRAMP family transporter